ncbi:MAG: GNAT family N-acetyltransferase [Flavobacteriales bacterium]
MKKILETERFYFRELTPDDAPMFYSLNLDSEITRYTSDTAFHSIAEAMDFLENYKDYELHGYGRWAIIEKATKESWGWCGLEKRENGDVDMGYRIFHDKWGKGCATECGKACVKYAFEELELEKLISEAVTENKASFRVMERIGFSYWKDSKDNNYDTLVYHFKIEDYKKTSD